MSEPSKWRHIVAPYCAGNGAELATGGDPIVPWSIQFELPEKEYAHYNSNNPIRGVVQWRSIDAIFNLPFKDNTLDYLASSHLLEDFMADQWDRLLREWVRVIKPGGLLVICVPEVTRWRQAIAVGQCPNCAHRHEPMLGELSSLAPQLRLQVVCEFLTDVPQGDYNILFVGRKI